MTMSTGVLSRRAELALKLLRDLKESYHKIDEAAESTSSAGTECYERAVDEMKDELCSILEEYNKNIDMIKQINKAMTSSINNWHNFIKDAGSLSMLTFPLTFHIRRKKLNKEIDMMNRQIAELAISNRFLKEKLAAARHRIEDRAISLAHEGEDCTGYKRQIAVKKELEAELKYLLPTIPGLCPADITSKGIDTTISAAERLLQNH